MTSTREGQFPADYKPDLSLEWAGPYPPKDAQKGEWDESKHPRGEGGRFGSGSGDTMVRERPTAGSQSANRPEHLAFISEQVNRFRDAGGTVDILYHRLDPKPLEAVRMDARNQKDAISARYEEIIRQGNAIRNPEGASKLYEQADRLAKGVDFMSLAANGSNVLVARDAEGTVCAAMNFDKIYADMDDSSQGTGPLQSLHVDLLGSNQTVPGAATALEYSLATLAVANSVGVSSDYIPDSAPYHEKIGRTMGVNDTGLGSTSEWSLEQCKEIANMSLTKMIKARPTVKVDARNQPSPEDLDEVNPIWATRVGRELMADITKYNRETVTAKSWDESQHPRGAGGRFGSGEGLSLSEVRASVKDKQMAERFAVAYKEKISGPLSREFGLGPKDQIRVNINSAKTDHFSNNASSPENSFARQYTVQYKYEGDPKWQTAGMISVKGDNVGYTSDHMGEVDYQGKEQGILEQAYKDTLVLSPEDKESMRGGGIEAAKQDPNFVDALSAWSSPGASAGKVSGEQMTSMTEAVKEYGAPSESPLFRGIGMQNTQEVQSVFEPGKTIDMAASSFSPDAHLAARYTDVPWAQGSVPVVLVAPAGTQALDVGQLFIGERESIVAGRFVVDKVEPFSTNATSNAFSAPTERQGLRVTLK